MICFAVVDNDIGDGWRVLRHPLTAQAKRVFGLINDILYNEWDPIGDRGEAPRSEYINYVPGIYSLLLQEPDVTIIVARLRLIQEEYIGLPVTDDERLAAIAQRLASLSL